MSKFVSEFKEFISRGNVVDMAVGIIMGSAFTAIVTSLVDDLIMPVIGMICAGVNIAELSVQVGSATLKYGAFLQAVLNFLIIALVIFSMVKAINSARAKAESLKKKKEEEAPKEEEKPDPQIVLLEEIRDLLAKNETAAK
ncbi:large-conductance mechanosensitive channel protein MscL [Allobaculum mucilyticum]|uniref:large-conductance mechanosensitive channel protein MscL n=1 Tax=Allobaculum mucilyticum TaxID=2834459 RepID=UPI001E3245D8|nr:large-conductance mechanosensitive channel protein MscL [Allobaculum mucilyticum]UNT95687.1 large-conductance mechanosensitive channel protein MscL [Allobaculum mucilyticum]